MLLLMQVGFSVAHQQHVTKSFRSLRTEVAQVTGWGLVRSEATWGFKAESRFTVPLCLATRACSSVGLLLLGCPWRLLLTWERSGVGALELIVTAQLV
jgi:hypothetical protein